MNPLSTILLAVASIAMTGADPAPSPTPMGCRCSADTISGILYGETSTLITATRENSTVTYNVTMNVNYKEKRVSFKGQLANGTKVHVILHREFAYVIDGDSQSCTLASSSDYLRFTPQQCLPADARYGGRFLLGTLATTIYGIARKGVTGFTAVTDDCIAVNAHLAVEVNGTYSMTTGFLSNAATTIDTSALDIPTFCPTPV